MASDESELAAVYGVHSSMIHLWKRSSYPVKTRNPPVARAHFDPPAMALAPTRVAEDAASAVSRPNVPEPAMMQDPTALGARDPPPVVEGGADMDVHDDAGISGTASESSTHPDGYENKQHTKHRWAPLL